jgi:2-(1,2-epoxy-1,2-dihydrophenyl)acetyl-CoA isomerase
MHDLLGDFHGFKVVLEEPGIAILTLNRPERLNGITLTMKRELVEWLIGAQVADAVRVLMITGEGRAFSAGDDISGKATELVPPRLVRELTLGHRGPTRVYEALRVIGQPLLATLRDFDKPTIAAVNGLAVQSGLSVALGCDFRIASESATLMSGTLRFGLMPDDGGHHVLVRELGYTRAARFIMLNEVMTANEARAIGLLTQVTSADTLLAEALGLARQLADGPQVAMRMVKRALRSAEDAEFRRALDDIAIRTAVSDYHGDATEGRQAFREKRAPNFNQWLENPETSAEV